MVKMDLKFIKTSNRSSFLSIKLLFSGFQISFSIIYSAKKLPTAIAIDINVFMSGVWHITVEWKIIDKGLGAIRAKIGPTSDVDKIFSKMYSQYVLFRNKYS